MYSIFRQEAITGRVVYRVLRVVGCEDYSHALVTTTTVSISKYVFIFTPLECVLFSLLFSLRIVVIVSTHSIRHCLCAPGVSITHARSTQTRTRMCIRCVYVYAPDTYIYMYDRGNYYFCRTYINGTTRRAI